MEDGSSVTVYHYLGKFLKLKSAVGSQRFCVPTKVIKCALSLSDGNADNERSILVDKKTVQREN